MANDLTTTERLPGKPHPTDRRFDLPDWIDEAHEELERLRPLASDEESYVLRRNTVIYVVTAILVGKSFSSSLATNVRPEGVASKPTYIKWRQNDPVFAEVFDNVYRLALRNQTRRALMSARHATEGLALLAPASVDRLAEALNDPDNSIGIRAAAAILDRVDRDVMAELVRDIMGEDREGVKYDLTLLTVDEAREWKRLLEKVTVTE